MGSVNIPSQVDALHENILHFTVGIYLHLTLIETVRVYIFSTSVQYIHYSVSLYFAEQPHSLPDSKSQTENYSQKSHDI